MLTYIQRAQHCKNPTAIKLLNVMAQKQTNLALSIDVTHKKELLHLADLIGPEICILKTHIDIVEDFDQELISQLKVLANKHQFLIFEDRKFADIGNTVKLQYSKGIYHIADWADITNAHAVPGMGVINGLKEIGLPKGNGLLLIAELSSQGALTKGDYVNAAIVMAKQNSDFVIGFIAQHKLVDEPNFISLTPGVQMQSGKDALGQQYITPEQAIIEQGSDIIIVGRGIYAQQNPLVEAKKYRHAGWQSYEKLLLKTTTG